MNTQQKFEFLAKKRFAKDSVSAAKAYMRFITLLVNEARKQNNEATAKVRVN